MAGNSIDKHRVKKYFAGNESEEDSKYVEQLFRDESKIDQIKYTLSSHWDEFIKEEEKYNDKVNLEHILHKIHYQINTSPSNSGIWNIQRISKWTQRIVAGIIILFAAYLGGTIAYNKKQQIAWVEIKAPAWSRIKFSLPDGTSGYLSSNSELRYNLNFKKKREVKLSGEAYFNVYKDKTKSFRLNTNDISVDVTGTIFNVASYPEDNQTEIVLVDGSITLKDKTNTVSFNVVPSELFIYDRTKKSFQKEVVQTEKYTSWIQGKLVFRDDPIDKIACRLGRWYNVDVEVKPGQYNDLRLHATFVDEDLEEVLKLLKLNLPINYKIEKRDQALDGTYQKIKVIISLRK